MCTSYENAVNPDLIYEIYSYHGITVINKRKGDYAKDNIRPTNPILTLLKTDDEYQLTNTNWGILFNEKSPLIFNSRIETIKEKPFWNNSFKNKRALLPMTGFYEWITQGKKKIRHKIFLPDDEFFFVPALYHEKEDKLFTSLVTVPPNEFVGQFHHRMPAILKRKEALDMLDAELETAIKLCKPFTGKMKIVESVIR